MSKNDVLMFLLAICVVSIIIFSVKNKEKKPEIKVMPVKSAVKTTVKTAVNATLNNKIEIVKPEEKSVNLSNENSTKLNDAKSSEKLKDNKKSMWESTDKSDDVDVPSTAFPSMTAEVGDSDAELAQAYTYENLQDSMLSTGSESRASSKSRNAWSRLGERANPEVWEAQMEELRKEIKSSGQTFQQFSENSWAPIPEQLASLWKESEESAQPEIKRSNFAADSKTSRLAMSEAASVTQDATQTIPVGNKAETLRILKEVLTSRKRAKSLGLSIPKVTEKQLETMNKLESDKTFSGTVRTIKSI